MISEYLRRLRKIISPILFRQEREKYESIAQTWSLLPRGVFDRVEYHNGELSINGWMLLIDKRLNNILVFINKEYTCDAEIIEREDVARAFKFIPHSKYSGFNISLKKKDQEMNGLIEISLIGVADGVRSGKLATCFSREVAASLSSPPVSLMKRVSSSEDKIYFMTSSFKSYYDFWSLACKYVDPKQIKTVLDWGCGCGRMTKVFLKLSGIPEIHGCDIDAEAIDWCEKNNTNIHFTVIPPEPPTGYPDNYFDLVISHSVLTHLTKDMQLDWLNEMKRIIKPRGFLLTSIHGEFATYFSFPNTNTKRSEILKDGICDKIKDPYLDGIAPRDYYRLTYQSQEYTKKVYGKIFEVLDYVESGSLNFQDIVVMQKS